ncbi:hypothetical protein RHMOL_Rhmol05G0243300 [Rhododendron molle]|uniref:Uncharacterized protein n=1 Tax=Rhododendron molle TaxID=49168 RepID=A0ACC0NST3_RHOML|nr:hypothetical protein RHMOL_Rhmol05G0243300 [Rhododendron molle]
MGCNVRASKGGKSREIRFTNTWASRGQKRPRTEEVSKAPKECTMTNPYFIFKYIFVSLILPNELGRGGRKCLRQTKRHTFTLPMK